MLVTKRNGTTEPVSFDKITQRIRDLSINLSVDPIKVAQKCVAGLYNEISTYKLDQLAAEVSASMYIEHLDYGKLAARIIVSDYHKRTHNSFLDVVEELYSHLDEQGVHCPLISDVVLNVAKENSVYLNEVINHQNDYNFSYFGFKTLERSYLLRYNDVPIERPQHMFMRVSIGIHSTESNYNLQRVVETYKLLSKGEIMHATPTLFNSGTRKPQLSSCFLTGIHSDSIEGIYDTLKECAQISKTAGGIGLHVSNIRATGAYIRGTNGKSTGIIPMLGVYNSTFRYVNQGGKRNGSCAIYLEPWHLDVESFLDLRKTHGDMNQRSLDLFTALWIPDLFMKRVERDEMWSLFCPDSAPGLTDCYGDEFEELYSKYEEEGLAKKQVKARNLFRSIINSQWETGTPYILFKDAANRKSNQKNLGVIKCSNLCTEIMEYTSKDEIAVCNLASVVLPKFVKDNEFDFDSLYSVTRKVLRNLNSIIDRNMYVVDSCKNSNMKHRPVGIGVQGMADCFIKMRYPFCSDEAKQLNKDIFETLYYAALEESASIAESEGCYESFRGSPASEGILQFDMWGVEPSSRWDWSALKEKIKETGLRNSLVLAPMPTASTAQILSNNECFEPYTSNMYTRRVLSGEFVVLNEHMVKDLLSLGLWTEEIRNHIMLEKGSIQSIEVIPENIRELYKTAWEMKMKDIIDMAADRGAFIDQSQSLNMFVEKPSFSKLYSIIMYGWKKGLKTGVYYLRTRSAADPIQFTVKKDKKVVKDDEECLMCSS